LKLSHKTVILIIVLLFTYPACRQKKTIDSRKVRIDREFHFINLLHKAEIIDSPRRFVQTAQYTIDRDGRDVLTQHPNSTLVFKDIPIYSGARLKFAIAINPVVWDKAGDGVKFELSLQQDPESPAILLFSKYIDPKKNPEERRWIDQEVDLKAYEGENVTLIFQTRSGPKNDGTYDWAGWGNPKLVSDGREITTQVTDHTNILLITADTLRADYLGCYGHKTIQTKILDNLAERGVLFLNHFSQTNITIPSHASILTSLYLKDHGVVDNYFQLGEDFLTLQDILKNNGYHTAAFVSASHMNPEQSGFGQGFDTFSRTGAWRIAQSSAIERKAETVNSDVFSWLDNKRQNPFFVWIHYFDPHSPYIPPAPYSTMYYKDDPRDPAKNSLVDFFKEKEQNATWLKTQKQLLRKRTLDDRFAYYLELLIENDWGIQRAFDSTKDRFKKEITLEEFKEWMREQFSLFKSGEEPDPEFLTWVQLFIDFLVQGLQYIDTFFQSWLMDVTDLQYPVSQYMGEISYLDAQIGALFDRLKAHGLYDRTIIAFTADHGESLGEHGIYFDHRRLFEDTIKVPLILEIPGMKEKGLRVSAMTDSIDILPTLLDLLGIEKPGRIRGRSLLEIIKGNDRDQEDPKSFAELFNQFSASIRTPKYKFIKELRTMGIYGYLRGRPITTQGKVHLYDIANDPAELMNLAEKYPDLISMFERQYSAWLEDRLDLPKSKKPRMDAETIERLRALGYIH